MMIISRTPVRISFFGGGSDYPSYFKRSPGAVLGTTINKHIYVSINSLSDFFDHKIRIGYSKVEHVKNVDEIEHPSIRECLKFMGINSHVNIHIFSDLPAMTGLGSSSSCTVGLLNALYAFRGLRVSKQQLAEEACHIEQNLIQENVGSQDQFHSAFGGFNVMEFHPSSIQVRPLVISPEKKAWLENHLMVFYTGLTRYASDVVKEQIEKTTQKTNDEYLKQMTQMVFEAENIVAHTEKETMIQELSKLLNRGWDLKKRLSSKISNSLIDQAHDRAIRAGAYGGKLCGAGSGGFLAFFVKPVLHSKIQEALKDYLQVNFRFENTGSSIIYMKE